MKPKILIFENLYNTCGYWILFILQSPMHFQVINDTGQHCMAKPEFTKNSPNLKVKEVVHYNTRGKSKQTSIGLYLFILFVLFSSKVHAQKVKILIFGDSQKIVNEAPASFLSSMDKILTDSNTKDADFILQMGDLVEDGLVSNWQTAQTGWQKLDGKIPYVLNIGNNDLVNDPGALKFNEYFPLSRYQIWPSFVSNTDLNTNVAHRFNTAGVTWLVISMKIAPNTSILSWAENLIINNSTDNVILISHDANSTSNVTQLGLKYKNVVMVLAGHTNPAVKQLMPGVQSNKMAFIKTCFHNKVLDLYSCILQIDVSAGTISGRYYSVQYGKYWDDPTAPYYGDSKMPTELNWTLAGFQFAKPNAISGVNDVKHTNNGKSVTIYPNPLINGKLLMDFDGFENLNNVRIRIIDLMGQTVHLSYLNNPTHFEMNVTELMKNAVYFLSVELGQIQITGKMIVN